MKRIFIAALAILYFAFTVNASTVLFKNYRDEKRKSYRSFNKLYLDGAKGGLIPNLSKGDSLGIPKSPAT